MTMQPTNNDERQGTLWLREAAQAYTRLLRRAVPQQDATRASADRPTSTMRSRRTSFGRPFRETRPQAMMVMRGEVRLPRPLGASMVRYTRFGWPPPKTLMLAGCLYGLWTSPVAAQQRDVVDLSQTNASVLCQIRENGRNAVGTVTVKKGQQTKYVGTCSGKIALPAGRYEVTMRLDGALDRPEIIRNITLARGRSIPVEANFSTGFLEVDIRREGRRIASMVSVVPTSGGKAVSIAAGVRANLSAGSYGVRATYRGETKDIATTQVEAGKSTRISAEF